jgi:hypothetical protein
MDKTISFLALVLVFFASLALFGCSQSWQADAHQQGQAGGSQQAAAANGNVNVSNPPMPGRSPRPGARSNITDAQRQEMDEARISACNGKADGDPCTTSTPREGMDGTCRAQNSTQGASLICGFGNGFGQGRRPASQSDAAPQQSN